MTRKQFYLDLGKYLMEDLVRKMQAPVMHFDLWNDQTNPDWKKPFPMPAVFLEFQPIQWKSIGKHVQQADVTFNLHIVQKVNYQSHYLHPLRDQNLVHLDLIDELHFYLTGIRGHYFTSLTRIASAQDHYFAELTDHVESWQTKFTSESAVRKLFAKHGDLLQINKNQSL